MHLSRALSSGLPSCVFSGCRRWGHMGPVVLGRLSGWSDRSGWLPVRLVARPCLTWRWHLLTGRPGLRGNWLRVLGVPGLVMVHWCAEPASIMGGCRTLVLSSSVDLLVDRAGSWHGCLQGPRNLKADVSRLMGGARSTDQKPVDRHMVIVKISLKK